jgi:alpha 1,6-mannosyltransferase
MRSTLVGEEGADHFVDTNFADHPVIIETYHNITNVGQKSDLLRYLLLYIEAAYIPTQTLRLCDLSTNGYHHI